MTYIRFAFSTVMSAFGILFVFSLVWHLISLIHMLLPVPLQYPVDAIAVLALLVAAYRISVTRRKLLEAQCVNWITDSSTALQLWLGNTSLNSIRIAIVSLAGLTLFLELTLIRWQSSLFPVFALYKNFTLLACFCGLGIGYALAKQKQLLFAATLPLLAVTLLFLILLRYTTDPTILNLLNVVPVQEETAIFGLPVYEFKVTSGALGGFINNTLFCVPVYLLLLETFALNVIVMLPAGQFCGALMEKMNRPLVSYGYNLLGSILSVVILFILSWLWVGPAIWFTVCALLLLLYLLPAKNTWKAGILSVATIITVCAWPIDPMVQDIYSPYQLIQKTTKGDGLMQILASGTYYQKVFNLSLDNPNRDTNLQLNKQVGYYELPFKTAASLDHVAIAGAGSGNDVAAALRNNAKNIDAVEIDPAIVALGFLNHPEHPYEDPRVHSVVNDARTFFRNTNGSYDAIVYGVIDSHILLSHNSNVRVDSFVYTHEGIQDAFSHLKTGGLLSVSFALTERTKMTIGRKIYTILKTLPGGGTPVAIMTGYDSKNTTTFMVSKGQDVKLPAKFMVAHDLKNITAFYADAEKLALDLPTDDWPFLYMESKMYPASYVASLVLVLILSFKMIRTFLPDQKLAPQMLPFFFLGSGFMLLETKAITELGLLFGNTWYVIGVAIISILIMAFTANILVSLRSWKKLSPAFLMLLAIIILGYVVALHGGVPYSGALSKLLFVCLLTSPLLFSGIIFSTLLNEKADLPQAMAYNLMGAMLGGALEYNSMEFGFAALYPIAFVLYALAWLTSRKA